YADFVSARRPDVTRPGDIVTADGEVIGQHRGLVNHTVGQRRGIGIAAPKPYFVLQLKTEENQLVVGSREQAEARSVGIHTVSMTSGQWPTEPFDVSAVVRYRGVPTDATVEPGAPGSREMTATFEGDSGPVASPGQAIVFYREDEVVGGGTIFEVQRRDAAGDENPGARTPVVAGERLVARNVRERQG
ncbi:MAG TPA: tRNA methyl transferase PRC-barrel domain-containing protein, partial [Thermomicrobiales bacterium]|nr:tRNA methyl transferase PRC-barrel domain-containing protein [Thermomicrobiales bacterium]